jgi:serine/threonine protein kinase
MTLTNTRWKVITPSRFPWEQDALEFVRNDLPDLDPYCAWSNFEFIAEDGSICEVDLLVFTPQGFFLIEIKSRGGRLFGDAGTWTWEVDGRLVTIDSPLILANSKAKRLRSLLQRQTASRKKGQLPFIEALVFCSAPELRCELQGPARYRVCLRDREKTEEIPARPGIVAAVTHRDCQGLDPHPKGTHDRPMARTISQAMEQAGIRSSQRHRKVSDYVLEQIIAEGPGYQDWEATHSKLTNVKRRVRIYTVRSGATEDERKTLERAAQREALLLETLQHEGVLRREGFTDHELGPALILEHDPQAVRLDHFIAQNRDKLGVDVRLDLIRQIAEIIRFAHDKKVVHRALSPQSILVTDVNSNRPRVKIYNWQMGYRAGTASQGVSREVSPTSHIDRLVDDISTAYMAPESLSDSESNGEHLDVFSLGAIAYHLFSGEPPAANGLELSNKLRENKGLQLSSVLNGTGEHLQFLIQYSTHPEVSSRIDSVTDFLTCLDDVEDELTTPETEIVEDVSSAQKGDFLPRNFEVIKRLGQGACSIALLVSRDGQEYVLKVASDPKHNSRLKDEAQILQKVRHQHIVEYCDSFDVGDRNCIQMRRAGMDTLGQRLRKDGRLHLDLLERFGEDLLDVVNYLEEQGIAHRDIKPDNIGIGPVGRGDKLHIILFDFSLSRTPPENIRAGTPGYLDPLLPLRKPPRWDLHAERYAAAATLYEAATGTMPKWGDGASDPSYIDSEITVEAEFFDASLRENLVIFFKRAFARDITKRFDNAEEMLRAWRHCFEDIDKPQTPSDTDDEAERPELLASASFDTNVSELGLSTRANNALDRVNILTVEDLLTVPLHRLNSLRGVGNRTRREIAEAVKFYRDKLGIPRRDAMVSTDIAAEAQLRNFDVESLSVDLLVQHVVPRTTRKDDQSGRTARALTGLDPELDLLWPSQSDVARHLDLTRARIGQLVGNLQTRWSKDSSITSLRNDVAEIIEREGGVMTAPELAEAILVARGSMQEGTNRTKSATAVARAAVEVERMMAEPRFLVRRNGDRIFIARTPELANFAIQLGNQADDYAKEEPLVPPARVLERFREISLAAGISSMSDSRLMRLAAAASTTAAVSSRQELYPRHMDAARALRLSQGALLGVPQLSVADIHERVRSRYPDATPLPDRPVLDDLLVAAGLSFKWGSVGGKDGSGCYVSPHHDTPSISGGSGSISRMPTQIGPGLSGEITPEIADARQFEERLERGIKEGSFLTLLVHPKYYQRAMRELSARFPVRLIDLEGLFIDALREVANKASVNWELVLQTDTTPNGGDWNKLTLLVGRAMPIIEQALANVDQTLLIVFPGLLARYDQMTLLESLRDKIGRSGGLPGLWVLVPGDQQALIDGKAVPIIGAGQKAQIPDSWLKNIHRANGNGDAHP